LSSEVLDLFIKKSRITGKFGYFVLDRSCMVSTLTLMQYSYNTLWLLQVLTRLMPDYKPNLPVMGRTYEGSLMEDLNMTLPLDQVKNISLQLNSQYE